MPTMITLPAQGGAATARIQAELDRAKDAPLHLTLGPGEHLSGGLRLFSGTTLELQAGAVLRFVADYDAYRDTTVAIEAEDSDRAMLVAQQARDITLCGKGQIQCDGAAQFSTDHQPEMGTRVPVALRPRVLVFDRCSDITLRDLTVLDSPMWTLHLVECAGVRLSGLRVDNDRRMPNTDGIVIDSCRDVTIAECEIRTADDGIVLKTSARLDGAPSAPCRDVTVTGCTIETRSCALKIGTESFADFHDLRFETCRIEASNRALGIFSRDGGAVRDVVFHDITLDCHETPDGFWGSGEPLTLNVLTRRPETPAGAITRVTVSHVRGSAPGAINLWSERQGLISEIALHDIRLHQAPGPLGTAQAYDLRPTPADLEASDDGAGRANAWRLGTDGRVVGLADYPGGRPAFFAHNVSGLNRSDIDISRPSPLPGDWSAVAFTETTDAP